MKVIHDATIITPQDDAVSTLRHHSLVFDEGRIDELVLASELQQRIDEGKFKHVIDGQQHVIVPGFVNTHHHLYQSLTRCLPAVQDKRLFDWLLGLYERWRHLDYQAVKTAAQISIAELLLHGCTTTSDHFYMLPRNSDVKMEAVLEAAESLGIRIHLCRGSMTLGQSHGGLPPDDCTEDDAAVLADCQRVLERYHNRDEYAMRRIDLAPCSPFNCTPELLRDTATMARERGDVLLHTHLAETIEEEKYCLEHHGCRPVKFLADLGFMGPDVYLAHCVYLNDEEITLFAQTQTGVSHCPRSNLRLGSGVAPLERLLAAEVPVGIGVDGSSSNDGGNILAEAKQALLSARGLAAGTAEPLMPVESIFKLTTIGGARCLHREVLGHLNPGAAADFAMFRTDDVALAGAVAQDPLAALILCDTPRADRVYVGGREVVRDGRLALLEESELADRMNELVSQRFCEGGE